MGNYYNLGENKFTRCVVLYLKYIHKIALTGNGELNYFYHTVIWFSVDNIFER